MDPTILSPEGQTLLTFIQAEFNKFTTTINSDLERNCHKINENCLAILNQKFAEVESLKQEVTVLKTQIQKLQGIQDSRDAQIQEMQDDADAANQYERKDTLILSGSAIPIMTESENSNELVLKLVKDKLKINMRPEDINTCHRLGPISRANLGKRNIIVKLCRRDMKKQILIASKKQDKGANEKLYCNESLSPLRRKMFNCLRKMKADDSTLVRGCSTMDGKVYAFTPPVAPNSRDQRHYIENMDSLQKFCREYVKQPIDRFLEHYNA